MCVRRIQLEVFRTSSRATTVCRRPSRAFACDSRLQLGGGVCVSAGGCPVGVNQARATVLVAGESTKPTRESLLPRLSFPRSAASQRDGLRDVGHLDVGVEGGGGAQIRRDALPRVDGACRRSSVGCAGSGLSAIALRHPTRGGCALVVCTRDQPSCAFVLSRVFDGRLAPTLISASATRSHPDDSLTHPQHAPFSTPTRHCRTPRRWRRRSARSTSSSRARPVRAARVRVPVRRSGGGVWEAASCATLVWLHETSTRARRRNYATHSTPYHDTLSLGDAPGRTSCARGRSVITQIASMLPAEPSKTRTPDPPNHPTSLQARSRWTRT